jgi:hypothetical protein
MPRGTQGGARLDSREVRQIEIASRALSRLPVGAPAAGVFDAIRACVPLAAGLFSVIRPSAPDAMITHAVRLPPEVFESWISTPPALLARTLAPVIRSGAGGLWRDSETLTSAMREQLEVMGKLDGAGLGEGAGYKILERAAPRRCAEHFMLALLMDRGELVPPRAAALLAALNPAIRDAVLRLELLLVARESILAQVVAEQALGYVCLARGGGCSRRTGAPTTWWCASRRPRASWGAARPWWSSRPAPGHGPATGAPGSSPRGALPRSSR